jgi:hypothetical protein
MDILLFILILLQIKHWYIDFVNQTDEEVAHKGIYLDWRGLKHSAKHGVASAAIFMLFLSIPSAVVLGIIDFVMHYHIDWAKMNYGNRDITNKQFWNHLGLDQMAHQIGYIAMIALLL